MRFAEWREKFPIKYQSYLEQLAQLGENVAQTTFNLADPEDGNDGVEVTTEMEDAGFRIIASGHDAAFIEFGTGVETTVIRPTVQADFDISDGSWSREALASGEQGGEYAKFGDYWHWNGKHYTGTAPLMPMQYACQEMEHMSNDIARRVFR